MAYWKDFTFASPIDDILKQSSFTLKDLLDEDEVVSETRNQKQELIDFLIKEENIQKLVSYVVDEPEEESSSEKEKFRYPAVAGEILSSEVDEIVTLLLQKEELMDKIFFFYNKSNINQLLSGVVSKVSISILHSKPKEVFSYLCKNPEIIDQFLQHMECPATIEFLTRLINIELDLEGKSVSEWLVEIGLVEKLFSKLSLDFSTHHADVAQAIQDVINVSLPSSPILNSMLSSKNLDLLFDIMLNTTNPTAFKFGAPVLQRLLKHVCSQYIQSFEDDVDPEESSFRRKKKPPNPIKIDQMPHLLQMVLQRVPLLRNLMVSPPSDSTLVAQDGETLKVFGYYRLRILDLFSLLTMFNLAEINNMLLDCGIFTEAFEFYFLFPHNNFSHKAVQTLYRHVIEGFDTAQLRKFLETTQIPQKLVGKEKQNKQIAESGIKRSNNIQYVPYIHNLATDLQSLVEIFEPDLKEVLVSVEGWESYINELKEEQKLIESMSGTGRHSPVSHHDSFLSFQSPSRNVYDSFSYNRDDDDDDDDDTNLPDDRDLDTNDADDYDVDQAEIMLSKSEIENYAM